MRYIVVADGDDVVVHFTVTGRVARRPRTSNASGVKAMLRNVVQCRTAARPWLRVDLDTLNSAVGPLATSLRSSSRNADTTVQAMEAADRVRAVS